MDRSDPRDTPRSGDHGDQAQSAPTELDLSVRLDLPFHEIKYHLISEFERAYLARCLARSEMNLSSASRSSGLSRKHLRTLIAKYGIQSPDDPSSQ